MTKVVTEVDQAKEKALKGDHLSRRWSTRIDMDDWQTLLTWAKDQGKPIGTVLRTIVSDALRSDVGRQATSRARKRLATRQRLAPEQAKLAAAINRMGVNMNQIATRVNSRDPLALDMLTALKEIEQALKLILQKGPDVYLAKGGSDDHNG